MALIGTSVEPGGVARIFFDLRKTDPAPEEASLIARAIERAFTIARSVDGLPLIPPGPPDE
jgi:hypothetical protein